MDDLSGPASNVNKFRYLTIEGGARTLGLTLAVRTNWLIGKIGKFYQYSLRNSPAERSAQMLGCLEIEKRKIFRRSLFEENVGIIPAIDYRNLKCL